MVRHVLEMMGIGIVYNNSCRTITELRRPAIYSRDPVTAYTQLWIP